jgi:hypothetical protein
MRKSLRWQLGCALLLLTVLALPVMVNVAVQLAAGHWNAGTLRGRWWLGAAWLAGKAGDNGRRLAWEERAWAIDEGYLAVLFDVPETFDDKELKEDMGFDTGSPFGSGTFHYDAATRTLQVFVQEAQKEAVIRGMKEMFGFQPRG